jgi:hypothetical protein
VALLFSLPILLVEQHIASHQLQQLVDQQLLKLADWHIREGVWATLNRWAVSGRTFLSWLCLVTHTGEMTALCLALLPSFNAKPAVGEDTMVGVVGVVGEDDSEDDVVFIVQPPAPRVVIDLLNP